MKGTKAGQPANHVHAFTSTVLVMVLNFYDKVCLKKQLLPSLSQFFMGKKNCKETPAS